MNTVWSMAMMSRLASGPQQMLAIAKPALHLLFGDD